MIVCLDSELETLRVIGRDAVVPFRVHHMDSILMDLRVHMTRPSGERARPTKGK